MNCKLISLAMMLLTTSVLWSMEKMVIKFDETTGLYEASVKKYTESGSYRILKSVFDSTAPIKDIQADLECKYKQIYVSLHMMSAIGGVSTVAQAFSPDTLLKSALETLRNDGNEALKKKKGYANFVVGGTPKFGGDEQRAKVNANKPLSSFDNGRDLEFEALVIDSKDNTIAWW